MFLTDPSLFLSGNNNANSAKTLINECIKKLSSFDFDGSSDCAELKSNLSNCNITNVINKIDTTKEDLLRLDSNFANQYMSLLYEALDPEKLDTSNMTEEEKMQYESLVRNFDIALLTMLEDYESKGLLTEEMKEQLEFTRAKVDQYDIKDKMSVLSEDATGYLALFEQYAEYDRKLIQLNPDFSEEEKVRKLSEYETSYNGVHDKLEAALANRIDREQKLAQLEVLEQKKEQNNGFFCPMTEDMYTTEIISLKEDLGIATQGEIDYKNKGFWERRLADTGTFVASAYTGLYSIVEGMEDGVVMLGGKVGICDKDWAADFVKEDRTAALYEGIVISTNMNTYSAYSSVHDTGELVGQIAGRICMSYACPWVNAVMTGVSALGTTSQEKLNEGYTFDESFNFGLMDGVVSGAEAYTFSQFNAVARQKGIKDILSKAKELTKTFKGSGGVTQILKNAKSAIGPSVKNALKQTFVTTVKDPLFWIPTGTNYIKNTYTTYLDDIYDKDTGRTYMADVWSLAKDAGLQFGFRFGQNAFQNFKTSMKGKSFADKISSSTESATTVRRYAPAEGAPATSTIVDNITFDGKSTLDILDETYDEILIKNYQYDLSSPEGKLASETIKKANAQKIYSNVDTSIKEQISGIDPSDATPQIESCIVNQDGSATLKYSYNGGELRTIKLSAATIRGTLNMSNLDATREVVNNFTSGNSVISHHYWTDPKTQFKDLGLYVIGKDSE